MEVVMLPAPGVRELSTPAASFSEVTHPSCSMEVVMLPAPGVRELSTPAASLSEVTQPFCKALVPTLFGFGFLLLLSLASFWSTTACPETLFNLTDS